MKVDPVATDASRLAAERLSLIRLREVAHGVKPGTFTGYKWLRKARDIAPIRSE